MLPYVATAALVGLAAMRPEPFKKSYTGARAANKPYDSFETFFPFYLTEHSEPVNRRLHVVGTSVAIAMMVFNPLIGMGLLGGGCIGFLMCEPLSGLPHGIFEFLSMIIYFLTFAHLNDVLSISFATLVCGYAFAWVGHFVFQKNRPATFIYPTYSLMGDFKMWSIEAPKLIQEVIGGASSGSAAPQTAPKSKN